MNCTDGWSITGYYLPAEDQFHGEGKSADVKDWKIDTFPEDFLRAAEMEGWAMTRYGWFLGWSDGRWTKANAPLNARGGSLGQGSLAVDPAVIPLGTAVILPNAPSPWNMQQFIADDTGGRINGQHVDIYCGAGSAAKSKTSQVTSNNGRVCF